MQSAFLHIVPPSLHIFLMGRALGALYVQCFNRNAVDPYCHGVQRFVAKNW